LGAVDDPQRPSVRGAFAAVPADLGADLLQATEHNDRSSW
jgi:hypothetical protein